MPDRRPTVRPPDQEDIARRAESHGFELSAEELGVFEDVTSGLSTLFEALGELPPEYDPPRPNDRNVDSVDLEDRCNAVITECRVRGEPEGPLSDWAIGVKDNVNVAGVPSTLGCTAFRDYVPSSDATVVSRLLEAGGDVLGKLNMESMAFSASGELSDFGPVLNPRDTAHLAGGSSSGSAAAVVDGVVDAALGTDQAGSVRLPAAWCGCVGYKPTYGLVPYTGTVGLGPSFDSIGVLTTDVADARTLLRVCAGPDGFDPRQSQAAGRSLETASERAPESLSIGVVAEGFGRDESDSAVDETVWEAIERCENDGVDVQQVSIPMHEHGAAIHRGVSTEETAALLRDRGVGRYLQGFYDAELAEYVGRVRRENPGALPVTLKARLLLGDYLANEYDGRIYAAAQNRRPALRAAYDEQLEDVDVLAMPTATKLPHPVDPDAGVADRIERAANMLSNTCPFNMSNHSAVSLPAGEAAGLPVGLMLIGDRGRDGALLDTAAAIEPLLPEVPAA